MASGAIAEVRSVDSATADGGALVESMKVESGVTFASRLSAAEKRVGKLGKTATVLHRDLITLQGKDRENVAVRAQAMMRVSDWVIAQRAANDVSVSEVWAGTTWGSFAEFCRKCGMSTRTAYLDIKLARSDAMWRAFASGDMVRETARKGLQIAAHHTAGDASKTESAAIEAKVAKLLTGASVARARVLGDQWNEYGLGETAETATVPVLTLAQKVELAKASLVRQESLIESCVKRLASLRDGRSVILAQLAGYAVKGETESVASRGGPIISASAAKLAAEFGLDPKVIVGTGRSAGRIGEIVNRDVNEAKDRREYASAASKFKATAAAAKGAKADHVAAAALGSAVRDNDSMAVLSMLQDESLLAAELATAE